MFDHHMWTPLWAIIAYVTFPTTLRLNAALLHQLSVIHNTVLIVFSAWTFVSLLCIVYDYGVVFEANYYYRLPIFKKVMHLFYLSKYYEFFDTFQLYLSGKKPIFLQKFHHIGAVLCWHLCYVYQVDAVWMPSLWNSFVHTVMYTYYLATLLKWSYVSPTSPWRNRIKRVITRLQLLQFFVQFSVVYLYYPPVETWFNFYIILFVATYGIILIYLFGQFYRKTYTSKD